MQRAVLILSLHSTHGVAGTALLYVEIVTVFCPLRLPGTLFLQYPQRLPSPLKVFTQTPPSPRSLP